MQSVLVALATTVAYVLEGQSMQFSSNGLPTVVEYRPTPQSMHAAALELPVVDTYLPATQLSHVVSAVAVQSAAMFLPAAHMVQG